MSTLHCALENGADLYVNERQKIRHYRARSTESRFFYFVRCIRKLRYYSDVTGLNTGFLPRGGELQVCQKEGGRGCW